MQYICSRLIYRRLYRLVIDCWALYRYSIVISKAPKQRAQWRVPQSWTLAKLRWESWSDSLSWYWKTVFSAGSDSRRLPRGTVGKQLWLQWCANDQLRPHGNSEGKHGLKIRITPSAMFHRGHQRMPIQTSPNPVSEKASALLIRCVMCCSYN